MELSFVYPGRHIVVVLVLRVVRVLMSCEAFGVGVSKKRLFDEHTCIIRYVQTKLIFMFLVGKHGRTKSPLKDILICPRSSPMLKRF